MTQLDKASVLLIYTGGTIGMVENSEKSSDMRYRLFLSIRR